MASYMGVVVGVKLSRQVSGEASQTLCRRDIYGVERNDGGR